MSSEDAIRELQEACEYRAEPTDDNPEWGSVDSLIAYKDALEDAYATLLDAPTIDARKAITHIQNMKDTAIREADEHEAETLTPDGSWPDWESECRGDAYRAYADALNDALNVVYLLAKGVTPEQGKEVAARPDQG